MTAEEMLQVAREFVAVGRSHSGWSSVSITEGKESRRFADREEFVEFLEAVIPILEREAGKDEPILGDCLGCGAKQVDAEHECPPEPTLSQRAHTLAIMAASLYSGFLIAANGDHSEEQRTKAKADAIDVAEEIYREVEKREG